MTNSTAFSLSIIIPTHGNFQGVKDLLLSIEKFPPLFPYEILVVTNLSERDTLDLANARPNCRGLTVGRLGVNHARNLGLKSASFPWVYFFDDDCLITDNLFFPKLKDRLGDSATASAFIGGRYLSYPGASPTTEAYIAIQNQWLTLGRTDGKNGSAYLIGGNCGGKKDSFLKLMFDENIIYGGSETELFLRAHRDGMTMSLFEDLDVIHHTQVDLLSLIRKAHRQAQGHWYLIQKGLSYQPIFFSLDQATQPNLAVRFFKNIYHFTFWSTTQSLQKRFLTDFLHGSSVRLKSILNSLWKTFFARISSLIESVIRNKKGE